VILIEFCSLMLHIYNDHWTSSLSFFFFKNTWRKSHFLLNFSYLFFLVLEEWLRCMKGLAKLTIKFSKSKISIKYHVKHTYKHNFGWYVVCSMYSKINQMIKSFDMDKKKYIDTWISSIVRALLKQYSRLMKRISQSSSKQE
jgi:hypothetical protein